MANVSERSVVGNAFQSLTSS